MSLASFPEPKLLRPQTVLSLVHSPTQQALSRDVHDLKTFGADHYRRLPPSMSKQIDSAIGLSRPCTTKPAAVTSLISNMMPSICGVFGNYHGDRISALLTRWQPQPKGVAENTWLISNSAIPGADACCLPVLGPIGLYHADIVSYDLPSAGCCIAWRSFGIYRLGKSVHLLAKQL